MSTKDFDEFLDRQQAIPEQEIDWKQERKEWLAHLERFYGDVEQFLADYIASGKVKRTYEEKAIFEDFIGKYTAKVMCLDVAGHKARFDPIGTNLIGAKGRVDLEGARGKARFVLVDENSLGPAVKFKIRIEGAREEDASDQEETQGEVKWAWKIATHPPRIQYVDLNKDTFLDVLLEVVGG